MLQTKVVEKIKTQFYIRYNFFLPENRSVYEIMWKYLLRAGRTTDVGIMVRSKCAICLRDDLGKKTDTHSLN